MTKQIFDDRETAESIIRQAQVCRIAFIDGDQPYVIPVCFGYADGALYFHCSKTGRKIDILKKNSTVCFEMDVDFQLIEADRACKWGVEYRSVVGFGRASLVEDPDAKRRALDLIMAQYSDQPHTYPEKTIQRTGIVRIDIEQVTTRTSGQE